VATKPTQPFPCASNPRTASRGDAIERRILFVTSYEAAEHLGRAAPHVGELVTVVFGSASEGLTKTKPIANEFGQLS